MVEKNGRMVPEWSQDSYAGSAHCLGDQERVNSQPRFGDPTNCPACAAMNTNPKLVERPKPKYALNIIRYSTKPNSYNLRNDDVEVQVWVHGDKKKLKPLQEVAEEKALHLVDFKVEDEGTQYKSQAITPKMGDASYVGNEDFKKNVKKALADDLYTEDQLMDACGDRLTYEELEMKIKTLAQEYAGPDSSPSRSRSTDNEDTDELAKVSVGSKTQESEVSEVSLEDLSSILD